MQYAQIGGSQFKTDNTDEYCKDKIMAVIWTGKRSLLWRDGYT